MISLLLSSSQTANNFCRSIEPAKVRNSSAWSMLRSLTTIFMMASTKMVSVFIISSQSRRSTTFCKGFWSSKYNKNRPRWHPTIPVWARSTFRMINVATFWKCQKVWSYWLASLLRRSRSTDVGQWARSINVSLPLTTSTAKKLSLSRWLKEGRHLSFIQFGMHRPARSVCLRS